MGDKGVGRLGDWETGILGIVPLPFTFYLLPFTSYLLPFTFYLLIPNLRG
jgi:hypothetical protein